MKPKFKSIIENIDVLNDEAKQSIVEAFESAVNTRVEERVELEVTQALEKLDEKHAAQLTSLIEAIDADHAKKFKQAIEHIDADHTVKLEKVVAHYEQVLEADAKALREELCEDISNFLDLYLEKVFPREEIKRAAENAQAQRVLEGIKQLVSIDEAYINNNIKEALIDGKERIDTLNSKLNESLKENMHLQRQLTELQSDLLLEKKTKDMPPAKIKYVRKLLENKSPEYIKENLNHVVEMFEREEEEDSSLIVESRQPVRRPAAQTVDTPPIIEEQTRQTNSTKNEYLLELEAQEKRIKRT